MDFNYVVVQDQELFIAKQEVKFWKKYLQILEKGLFFCLGLLENTEVTPTDDDFDLCWRVIGKFTNFLFFHHSAFCYFLFAPVSDKIATRLWSPETLVSPMVVLIFNVKSHAKRMLQLLSLLNSQKLRTFTKKIPRGRLAR